MGAYMDCSGGVASNASGYEHWHLECVGEESRFSGSKCGVNYGSLACEKCPIDSPFKGYPPGAL